MLVVRQLKQSDLINVANNLITTKHSLVRANDRLGSSKLSFIKSKIINSNFAFIFGKGEINIKIDDSENYFVISKHNKMNYLITIKQLSSSGKTLKMKYDLLKAKMKA